MTFKGGFEGSEGFTLLRVRRSRKGDKVGGRRITEGNGGARERDRSIGDLKTMSYRVKLECSLNSERQMRGARARDGGGVIFVHYNKCKWDWHTPTKVMEVAENVVHGVTGGNRRPHHCRDSHSFVAEAGF